MAKRVREKLLDTRAAREKLAISGKPYYRAIDPELHLGYRKGKDARRWVARVYLGNGEYRVETIGYADDIADADGVTVLTLWQAQEKARAMKHTATAKHDPVRYTVRHAIADYVEYLEGKPTQLKTKQRLAIHIPPALADKPVAEVTAQDLDGWLRGMVKQKPRARTARDATKPSYWRVDMSDQEIQRRRKSTTNRVMTNFKAALNLAFRHGKVPSDAAWRRVKLFRGVDAARVRYLTVAEAKRLINACEPELRALVQAALATGARYSELARLRVEDFNPDSGTLQIRRSKSGKARHIVLTEEGQELFASLAAGQPGSALLLGKEWRDSMQARPMAVACERAKIDPPITFHGLRHTWASLCVMAGLPLMVVAKNLGHVSTAMVEAHYGHLATSYVSEAIRKHAPRFGGTKSNVKAIR